MDRSAGPGRNPATVPRVRRWCGAGSDSGPDVGLERLLSGGSSSPGICAPRSTTPVTEREVDILLVGGVGLGALCADLRRHGFAGSVLLVGDEDRAPPIGRRSARSCSATTCRTISSTPSRCSGTKGAAIDVVTGVAVHGLDVDQRRATLSGGRTVHYERLLVATGAAVRRLSIPGADGAIAADGRRRPPPAPGWTPVRPGRGGCRRRRVHRARVASGLATLGLRPTVVEAATGAVGWLARRDAGGMGSVAPPGEPGCSSCSGPPRRIGRERSPWAG